MRYTVMILILMVLMLAVTACGGTRTPMPTPATRSAAIPSDAVKVTPADDPWPPVAAPGWSQPMPLGPPVNTAGGEDSPFVTPDGQTLYFFFTPDVQVPAQE